MHPILAQLNFLFSHQMVWLGKKSVWDLSGAVPWYTFSEADMISSGGNQCPFENS
jgi:hypothetical protein